MYDPFLRRDAAVPAGPVTDLNDLCAFVGNRFAVLAGAGISLEAGFPLARSVAREFLGSMGLEPFELTELEASLDPDHVTNVGFHSFLRFEHLFDVLSLVDDPTLHSVRSLYSGGEPIASHQLLARHVEAGNPVFTVNFDTLIEKASAGVRVLESESSFADTSAGGFVGKLHGSVDGDLRRGATLTGLRSDLVGSGNRWGVFCDSLRKMPIVVVGYSGSDDFDVMHALNAVGSHYPLVWVQHVERETPEIFSFTRLAATFDDVDGLPPKLRTWMYGRFRDTPHRHPDACFLVTGRTTDVLAALTNAAPLPRDETPPAVRPMNTIHLSDDGAALARAWCFSRLHYGSWAHRHAVVAAKSPQASIRDLAHELMAFSFAQRLELDRAHRLYSRLAAAASSRQMVAIAHLRYAETRALQLVASQPLEAIGMTTCDPRRNRARFRKALEQTRQALSKLEDDSGDLAWVDHRLAALDVLEKQWGPRIQLAELLDGLCARASVRRIGDSALLDPFLEGMLWLVYWYGHRHETTDEFRERRSMSALHELMAGTDALRYLYPTEIYPEIEADAFDIPAWRQRMWFPPVEGLKGLSRAIELFDSADEGPWAIAAELLLWDDERRQGWEEWSWTTGAIVMARLHKAGSIRAALNLASYLPWGG